MQHPWSRKHSWEQPEDTTAPLTETRSSNPLHCFQSESEGGYIRNVDERTQRLKHLPCKKEDQSLGPQDPHKCYMGVMACLQFQPQKTLVRCLRTGSNQLGITVSQQALDLIQKPYLQELSRRGIKKEFQLSTSGFHKNSTHVLYPYTCTPMCKLTHIHMRKKEKKRPRKQKGKDKPELFIQQNIPQE